MKLSQVDLITNVIKENFLSYLSNITNDLSNEDQPLSLFPIWQNFKAKNFDYNSKIELNMSVKYFNLIKNHENPSFSSVVEKLPKPYGYRGNPNEIKRLKDFIQNHQISNDLLNRAIEEEYNQNGYSEDVDKLNKQIIKELILKQPDYKILMDCLTRNNTDLDLYSELFSKLFIKDKNLKVGLTFDKENNTNLIDLLNPIKTITINNDDINIPIAFLHYSYLDSVDKHLQEYIDKNFLKDNDYWIKIGKLLNQDKNNVLEEIYSNQYDISLLFANLIIRNSYLLTLPHKVVPKNVNLTTKLINQNNSLSNSTDGYDEIINDNTIEIKPLVKFFEVKSDRNNTINNQRPSLLTLGKYFQRVLDFPADSQEIQNLNNLYKAEIGTLKLNFIPNNDVENWIQVYKSPYLSSCMSKEDTVDSIRSYAISSSYWDYNQKVKSESEIKMEKRSFKDNGLVLCYCGDIRTAQSRAIVNLKNKQYVSSYGDKKTIDFLLQEHGFKKNDKAFENIPIVITKRTRHIDNKSENIWFGPYVDGDTQSGNIDFEIRDNNRELMLVRLTSEHSNADVDLSSDQAWVVHKWHEFKCLCCKNVYDLNQANPIFTIKSDGTLYDSGTSICKKVECENDHYYSVPVYKGYEQIWIDNYDEALEDENIIKCNNKYYINDTQTLHIHDIVHSEYQNKWLNKKASDVVYVEHINDYVEDKYVVESDYLQEKIIEKESCWSDYHDSYLIESNCVYSKQFNSHIDENIAVLVDNEYFPDDALDTDSDGYYRLNDKGQRYLGLDEDEALELMYSIQDVEIPTPEEEDEPTYSGSSKRKYR